MANEHLTPDQKAALEEYVRWKAQQDKRRKNHMPKRWTEDRNYVGIDPGPGEKE
ncbi:MAG TPA: hypothetical protein VN802_14870 [Stellaceae bacterium]|nr:hypothetical protein [Stellaceae bacterium]